MTYSKNSSVHELTNTFTQTITQMLNKSTQMQSMKDEHELKSVRNSINRGSIKF